VNEWRGDEVYAESAGRRGEGMEGGDSSGPTGVNSRAGSVARLPRGPAARRNMAGAVRASARRVVAGVRRQHGHGRGGA
jgi:hypothetical protein